MLTPRSTSVTAHRLHCQALRLAFQRAGIEPAGRMLLGEIERDGEQLEQHEAVVDDHRQPAIRVDGEKFRRARAGVADLDRIVLVVEAKLLRHPERAEGAGAGDAVNAQAGHWMLRGSRYCGSILAALIRSPRTAMPLRTVSARLSGVPANGEADGGEPLLHRISLENLDDLVVQARDDRGGRSGRREKTEPGRHLEAGHGLGNRRHIRDRRIAGLFHDREQPDLAGRNSGAAAE